MAEERRALLLVLTLLAFALVLREQPIWSMGQYQDDAVLSAWRAEYLAQGKSLWNFAVDTFNGLARSQGRVTPVAAFLLVPLWVWVEDNLFLYRVIQTAAQLAALGAFALFVRAATRDALAATLCVVLYVAMFEVRYFHDAAHSYFVVIPYVVAVGSLACLFAIRAVESDRPFGRPLWWVVGLNVAGVLGYELAAPFAALSCLILLFGGNLPWRTRLARAVLAGLPVVAMALAGFAAKAMLSRYEGTQVGSLDPAVLGPAYFKHLSAAIPLSYWWHDPHQQLEGLLRGTRYQPGPLLSAAAIALALGVAAWLCIVRGRIASLRWLGIAGLVLLLAPPALIAVSLKYQREAVAGVGYLQNSISYLGTSVLLCIVLHLACRKAAAAGPMARNAGAALAAGGIGLLSAVALLCSYRVAETVNENWRHPREQLEVWMHLVRPPPGVTPRVAIDRAWLNRWESRPFMLQHWGVQGTFVTMAEAQQAGATAVLHTPLRPHPEALNLFIETSPGTTRALVISTDRERLAQSPLALMQGAQSWPFPADTRRGRHGYYYRELALPGARDESGDYRLATTVARPASRLLLR